MLQPVTLSAVIILGHMSLKIFDLIVALGNKDIRLDVPGIYMWTTTFDGTNYAQGAAIGILMFISVAVLVDPYLIQNMRTETQIMNRRHSPLSWINLSSSSAAPSAHPAHSLDPRCRHLYLLDGQSILLRYPDRVSNPSVKST